MIAEVVSSFIELVAEIFYVIFIRIQSACTLFSAIAGTVLYGFGGAAFGWQGGLVAMAVSGIIGWVLGGVLQRQFADNRGARVVTCVVASLGSVGVIAAWIAFGLYAAPA